MVAGSTVFARELGPPDGAPLVLVHGVVVSGRYMLPAARELARRGLRVLVPDLPGSGYSDKPWPPLGTAALADVLSRWLDAIGVRQAADFAGNSFGCQVLIEFALRHPERVRHLILQGPTVDPTRRSALAQLRALLRDAVYEPGVLKVVLPDYWRVGFRRAFAMSRIALNDRPEEKLSRVRAPTLVLRGERDPLVSPEWAKWAAERLPNGGLQTVAGAAHTVNYSNHRAFAEAVIEFLRRDGGNNRG